MKKKPGHHERPEWLEEIESSEDDWVEPEPTQDPRNEELWGKSGHIIHENASVPQKGGAVRGDQQDLNMEARHGAIPRGNKHRGRG